MSKATGGNKKSSSKSDLAYWARAQAAKFSETHRAKRIARHQRRMARKRARRAGWEARKLAKRAMFHQPPVMAAV
jgi:hypothetical protein